MSKPIIPDKILLIEACKPIPIHGMREPEVQLGENGFPLFRVEIARLVRETQIIIVEAPNQEYLQNHIHDVYDIYEDKDVDDLWASDPDFPPMEGTGIVVGTVSDAGVPAIVDVALNGKEDDFDWPGQPDK